MKVGDYVRMSWGISKVSNIYQRTDGNMVFDTINGYQNYFTELRKSSPNIIDLIEVGDYVNESKVVDISIIGNNKEKWVWVEQMEDTDNKYGDDYVGYNNDQIKSIVTKEQFESMEYRIGD